MLENLTWIRNAFAVDCISLMESTAKQFKNKG